MGLSLAYRARPLLAAATTVLVAMVMSCNVLQSHGLDINNILRESTQSERVESPYTNCYTCQDVVKAIVQEQVAHPTSKKSSSAIVTEQCAIPSVRGSLSEAECVSLLSKSLFLIDASITNAKIADEAEICKRVRICTGAEPSRTALVEPPPAPPRDLECEGKLRDCRSELAGAKSENLRLESERQKALGEKADAEKKALMLENQLQDAVRQVQTLKDKIAMLEAEKRKAQADEGPHRQIVDARILGKDRTTAGDWKGKYGTIGGVIFGYTPGSPQASDEFWGEKLSIEDGGATHIVWKENTVEKGGVASPSSDLSPSTAVPGSSQLSSTARRMCGLEHEGESTLVINFPVSEHPEVRVGFYFVDPTGGHALDIFVYQIARRKTPDAEIDHFKEGVYVVFNAQTNSPLYIHLLPKTGSVRSEWLLTGIFVDKYDAHPNLKNSI